MEAVITMDKFGRMVLPGPMRKALQISRPAAFKAEVMGNKVELTLVAPERSAVLKKRRAAGRVSEKPNPSVPSVTKRPGTHGRICSGTARIQSDTAMNGPVDPERAFVT